MSTPATTAIANTASASLRERIRDVQEAARGVTTLYPRSYILQCIKEDRFPDELWQKLGEFGLLGLSVPEEYGGSGGGVLEITALGGYTLIIAVMLAAIGLLVVARREGPALFVFLSIFSGWLMSSLLKSFYARPRPDLVPQLDLVHTASFPSGHATMSTVCYLTLAIVIARLTDNTRIRVYVVAVAILVSIAVGLSRVYLGVHWPSDVLAGWALGAAWAALSWLVVSLLRRRRKAATQEVERR